MADHQVPNGPVMNILPNKSHFFHFNTMDKTTYILGVGGLPGQDGGMMVDSTEKEYSLFALNISPKSD